MLLLFHVVSQSSDSLPAIATEGLNDVWYFYLPLMVFTLCTIYFFTRKRERPNWTGFAINNSTITRDLTLALSYLLGIQILLGTVFNIGLHFPGPANYQPGSHDVEDVIRWATLQGFFFIVIPYLWLKSQGFSCRKFLSGIDFKRDIWIIFSYWCGDFFGVVSISNFSDVSYYDYTYAIPLGILFNTVGAGLPVLIMIHVIIIPRLSMLLNSQLLVISLGGFTYALFSLFDPGVSYASGTAGLTTISYILVTQTLIGMGKASFTVRTGNPFVHFISYHILGARVAFDTAMYADIFRRKKTYT